MELEGPSTASRGSDRKLGRGVGFPSLSPHLEGNVEDKVLLSTREAAGFLGVHVRTLHRMIRRGAIPVYRLPGSNRLRFKKAELLAALVPVEPNTEGRDGD
jgi:excisionase family DNA binding protein